MADFQKILGIDPGYGRMGYAVIEKNGGRHTISQMGCVETDKKLPHAKRLCLIGDAILKIAAAERPEALALEKIYFAKNQKTSLQVAEARGVITYAAAKNALPIMEFTPLEVKMAVCGYGRADKAQIKNMIERLIDLGDKKQLDDTIDAVAIALTAFAHERILRLNEAA